MGVRRLKKIITILTIIFGLFISCSNGNAESSNKDTKVSSENTQNKAKKVLVVYFSSTGNTKRVAEFISSDLKSEIFEIIPEIAYTSSDLNWRDSNSRSMKELSDESARPEIKNKIKNLSQYNTIFLGYPIWSGEAPKIMLTFMESNDFTGKTVIPFVTSDSSGIGSSAKKLEKLGKGATWKEGRRFSAGSTEEEVKEWISSLGL